MSVTLGEGLGFVAGLLPMVQARQQHGQQLSISNDLHREAIRQNEQLAARSLTFDIHAALRENSRDVMTQKSGTAQTLMV